MVGWHGGVVTSPLVRAGPGTLFFPCGWTPRHSDTVSARERRYNRCESPILPGLFGGLFHTTVRTETFGCQMIWRSR